MSVVRPAHAGRMAVVGTQRSRHGGHAGVLFVTCLGTPVSAVVMIVMFHGINFGSPDKEYSWGVCHTPELSAQLPRSPVDAARP